MRAVLSYALAAVVAAALPCIPEQIFISYASTPDEMMVSWATSTSGKSVVSFGLSPSSLTSSVEAQEVQYNWTYNTETPDYSSPFLQHALITGLVTGTQYFYTVGGGNCAVSSVFNFSSHPGVGADISLTFVTIGDLGQTNNSQSTLDHITAHVGDFGAIMHFGDLSYADGNETRWDTWGRLVQPVASGLPWMTHPGNHEYEYTSSSKKSPTNPIAYASRFWTHGVPSAAKELYYSIDIGPVHFLLMDGYGDYSAGSAQHTWVLADLGSVDRTKTPWLVVAFHQPYYNSNTAHAGEGAALAGIYETPFFSAGVDLCFSGHVHAYERSFRTYLNESNAAAPYYITIGDGGNREGLAATWTSPQPAWSAFRQASYGHGELEVINATHMHWTWHQNPDLEPVIADEFWIVKGHSAAGKSVTATPRFAKKN